MVCHGNICRSPMAEFIMKDLISKRGLSSWFYIASAATSREEIRNGVGNPVYPPAREELAKHGLSCERKRAVQLTGEDYYKYDYLIGMDENNLRNMRRLFGGDSQKKLYKLLTFAGEDRDISDPWYTGRFQDTYEDVLTGCQGLLNFLEKKYPFYCE